MSTAAAALLVAIGSLVVSGLVGFAQIRLTRKHNDLAAKVRGYQLQEYERAEEALARADVRAYLTRKPDRIILVNEGGADASKVDVRVWVPGDEENSPLVEGDIEDKLPVPRLEPGAECPLLAAIAMGRFPPFDAVITWSDPDGSPQRRETRLHG